jgi:MSHA biogenesis protein MshM
MYLTHFGFKEFPFGITPDTQFIFPARAYQEAMNTLWVALETGEGFVKVTGEVGTGKTLLCRQFLKTLDGRFVTAYLPNPQLEPRVFLQAVGEELRAEGSAVGGDFTYLTRCIYRRLIELAREGKRVLLCIDEAQTMPQLTLESMRLLSNLETEKRKLMQIVLFGQTELDAKLSSTTLRQLLQRIAFHYRMSGLGSDEVGKYVDHRLRLAGHGGRSVFTPTAKRALYFYTEGTPRLVNVLAHKGLLSAFGEGLDEVGFSHIRRAAHDTQSVRLKSWWKGMV